MLFEVFQLTNRVNPWESLVEWHHLWTTLFKKFWNLFICWLFSDSIQVCGAGTLTLGNLFSLRFVRAKVLLDFPFPSFQILLFYITWSFIPTDKFDFRWSWPCNLLWICSKCMCIIGVVEDFIIFIENDFILFVFKNLSLSY